MKWVIPRFASILCVWRYLIKLFFKLPAGLPQNVVDDIVQSLIEHSALNATTLRVLKNCEVGTLCLAGCRGVTDDWLEPLAVSTQGSDTTASSPALSYFSSSPPNAMERIDLGDFKATSPPMSPKHANQEESSCSTSSFVSATSTLTPVRLEIGRFPTWPKTTLLQIWHLSTLQTQISLIWEWFIWKRIWRFWTSTAERYQMKVLLTWGTWSTWNCSIFSQVVSLMVDAPISRGSSRWKLSSYAEGDWRSTVSCFCLYFKCFVIATILTIHGK